MIQDELKAMVVVLKGVERNMENNKAVLLELVVEEQKYIFPNTESEALIDANDERINLEEQICETLETIKALNQECDK